MTNTLRFASFHGFLATSFVLGACGGSTTDHVSSTTDAGSDVTSMQQDAAEDVQADTGPALPIAVPLSSCAPLVYTAPTTVGSQTFQVALDTGSTTLGVAASSCTSCAEANPKYTPGATAKDQHATATSVYGSGQWGGEIYQDNVGLGSGPSVPLKFVAIDTQSQFFEPIQCDSKNPGFQGIMGLGPAASAVMSSTSPVVKTQGFFDELVADQHFPNIFAMRLCDGSGTMWLGGYDPSFTTSAPNYVPISDASIEGVRLSDYYYAVELTSISISGQTAAVGSSAYPASIVDTGTSALILPTTTFDTITAAVAASPMFADIFGQGTDASWFSNPGNCQMLQQTKAELDAALPPLTLEFGSVSVKAAATDSYLVSYEGAWCPAMQALDPSLEMPISAILGSPILRSNIVIFDRENKRIGFAPQTACP